jgi:hypothetical protein
MSTYYNMSYKTADEIHSVLCLNKTFATISKTKSSKKNLIAEINAIYIFCIVYFYNRNNEIMSVISNPSV